MLQLHIHNHSGATLHRHWLSLVYRDVTINKIHLELGAELTAHSWLNYQPISNKWNRHWNSELN